MWPDRGQAAATLGTARSRTAASRDAGWCLQSQGRPSYNLPKHSGSIITRRKAWESRKQARAAASWDRKNAVCGPVSAIARADWAVFAPGSATQAAPAWRACARRREHGILPHRLHSSLQTRAACRAIGTIRTASRHQGKTRPDAVQFSLPRLWHGVVLHGFGAMPASSRCPRQGESSMRANSWCRALARCLLAAMVMTTSGCSVCKSLNERYIAMEVWKYEKFFGHLPPGFVPPGAMPAAAPAAMRPCGQAAACQGAPCGSGEHAVGAAMPGGNCDQCQGGIVEGGMPSGTALPSDMRVGPGSLPVGPGGSPGPSAGLPTPAAVTSSRPVIISDEVVLP